jgi:Glycosyl hydrolases family 16
MANLLFKSLFGGIPKTAKLEEKRAALIQEHEEFKSIESSEELAEYQELDQLVNGDEFVQKKNEIQALKFEGTEQQQKLKEYEGLTKSKPIKNYYKILESENLKRFNQISESDDLAKYNELNETVNSPEFTEAKKVMAEKLTEEINKEKAYKKQKNSKKIKDFYKTKESQSLVQFNELDGSEKITEYEALQQYAASGDFDKFKQNLLAEKKKEDEKVKEFNKLKNSKVIKSGNEEENQEIFNQYKELETYINSDEFKTKQEGFVLENSDEYAKIKKFKELKKDASIKSFYKFKSSKQFADFNQLNGSQEISDYEELEAYVSSPDYKMLIDNLTYANTDEFKKEQEYTQLKKSDNIKFYFKYSNNSAFKLFKEIEGSEQLSHYEELKEFVNSQEFADFKTYMEDKKKWEKTDEFAKEQRYHELKKSENIIKYFKLKDTDKFNILLDWEITFEEDFSSGKLDTDKWMTSFFWGKALINDSYSLEGDSHYNTDGNNIEVSNNTLKIFTKKEDAKGKIWSANLGFQPKDFEYTSGLISTGNGFRQKHGKFEAKIKLNRSHPGYQAFWMVGEQMLPEIDIINATGKGSGQVSNYYKNESVQRNIDKISGLNLSNDFFIYTLEWTAEKLIWKINDIEIYSTSQGVPDEPLYMIFSAGLRGAIDSSKLPQTMEIDWIKCYKKKD